MSPAAVLERPALGSPPADEARLEPILPDVELIESDGEPLESDWHVQAPQILRYSLDHHFRARDDYYVATNMFLYYSVEQARNRDFKGPDFFYLADTHREPMRPYWAVWLEEGRTPDVVVEFCSPTTLAHDYWAVNLHLAGKNGTLIVGGQATATPTSG